MTTTDLPDRVRASLRHRAEALVVDVPAFDPSTPTVLDLPDGRLPHRRVVLAAAVVVVSVGLVAGALALASAGGGPEGGGPAANQETSSSAPADTPPAGAAALAPSFVPTGLALTAITVTETTEAGPLAIQLFASSDGRARLRITAEEPGDMPPGASGSVVVRGQRARAFPSDELSATSSALSWAEGGHVFTADHLGMTGPEAVAFLDAMAPRADAGAPLFDAPPGDLALVAEATGGTIRVRTTEATLSGGGRSVALRATEVIDGGHDLQGVRDAYLGGEDHEGTLVSYDDRGNRVVAWWPDGRRVTVFGGGSAVEQELREVALGVAPIGEGELADLQRAAEAAATADTEAQADGDAGATSVPAQTFLGPVFMLARDAGGRGADLQLGIEVDLGDPDAPEVCVSVEILPEACDSAPSVPHTASVLIDGHWYVGAASLIEVDAGITLGSPSSGADPVPVPGVQAGEVDGWVLRVVAVPDDVDEVWVGTDVESAPLTRPTE